MYIFNRAFKIMLSMAEADHKMFLLLFKIPVMILNYRDFALLAGPTRRRYIRKRYICLQVLQRARE